MALVNMMLSRAVKTVALARGVQRAASVAVVEARTFATESEGGEQKQQRQQRPRNPQQQSNNQGKNVQFGDRKNNNNRDNRGNNDKRGFNDNRSNNNDQRGDRKFNFALKDKQNKRNDGGNYVKREDGAGGHDNKYQSNKPQQSRKKFTFAPSVKAKEKTPDLEIFDAPAYFNEDFPVEFDESMKHEVEKLEIFADFTMLIDSSWQKEIHPLFDGETIELTVNVPLEDFDERLFIENKNTYDTKVVMLVPLACFKGLTPQGLEIVKQLAGPRYNADKKQLKLTEDRYASRVHNHKRLCDILRDLTQSAHELATAQTVDAEE